MLSNRVCALITFNGFVLVFGSVVSLQYFVANDVDEGDKYTGLPPIVKVPGDTRETVSSSLLVRTV